MKHKLFFINLLLITAFTSFHFLYAGVPPVRTGPAPSWIKPVVIDHNEKIPEKEISNGYTYLLLDDQTNVKKEISFTHHVIKIVSEEGIQNASEISVNYDPSYEKLVFHSILVWRDGRSINSLEPSKFKVLQQETDLNRFIYNGSLSAMIFLEDIRKGDVIEYSYSLQGRNPVFEDKYFSSYYLQGSLPVIKLSYRLLIPVDRKINIKNQNTEIKPVINELGENKEYLWQLEKIPALVIEGSIPEWYDPYPNVQISEYSEWSEVVRWNLMLFKVKTPISAEIKNKIDEIRQNNPDEEQQLLAALHFTQDEIRYLGIEMGKNSHEPNPPGKVFRQRFGDCKDKALLLCTILKELNIEANPALVNTERRQLLNDMLPTPIAFNHCIVQVKMYGKDYWLDPTSSHQGGKLGSIAFPAYRRALVIKEGNDSLSVTPEPLTGRTVSEETFDIKDSISAITLTVKTTYYDANADKIRSSLASTSITSLEKSYLNYYAKSYPEIKKIKSLGMDDNKKENIVITTEEYEIKNIWTKTDSSSGQIKCNFYAQSIRDLINTPSTTLRKMPLSLNYPFHFKEIIKIIPPIKWNISEDSTSIGGNGTLYQYHCFEEGKNIILEHDYTILTDHIKPEEVSLYLKNNDKIFENLGYNLSWSKLNGTAAQEKETYINWTMVLLAIFFITICVFIAYRFYSYDAPVMMFEGQNPLPIGSWLAIIAIGIIINPFKLMYVILDNNFFNLNIWNTLTSPDSPSYHELWAPGLLTELLGNCLLLVMSCLLAVLFFQKRSSFPRFMTFFMAFDLVFLTIDHLLVINIPAISNQSGNLSEIIRVAIYTAIWVPYLNISERSKGTFIITYHKEKAQLSGIKNDKELL
jgi:transglutaminase-like putative cysteine protease